MPYYAAACGLGLLAGAAFAWLWLKAVPPGTNRRHWSSMSRLAGEMLRVDTGAGFLSLYRRLGAVTGGYLARNLGGALLGCLPLLLVLLTAAPRLFEAWDARAQRATLVPAHAAQYLSHSLSRPVERTGYCSSSGYCALFAALDFKVVPLEEPEIAYAVLRADHSDVNPLWPFLSDLEAALFAAFVLGALAGVLWPSLRRRS